MPKPASSDVYRVVATPGTAEIRVKGSRFIGRALPANSEERAQDELAAIRREFHDATHHCSAWRLGPTGSIWRANDDGEPSGSAGQPILRRIESADVTDCVVVVTRYFGGTKLGTGGLVRAYGEVAASSITDASTATRVVAVVFRLVFSYADTSAALRTVELFHGRVEDSVYAEDTTLVIAVPRSLAAEFEEAIVEAMAGRVRVERPGRDALQ